jgi:hypothetical protein
MRALTLKLYVGKRGWRSARSDREVKPGELLRSESQFQRVSRSRGQSTAQGLKVARQLWRKERHQG